MMVLQAPYPHLQTTTILPNPELDDSLDPIRQLNAKVMMDGSQSTYVRDSGQYRREYTIIVTKEKFEELYNFFKSYAASQVRVTEEWTGRVYAMFFEEDRLEGSYYNAENDVRVTFSMVGKRLV